MLVTTTKFFPRNSANSAIHENSIPRKLPAIQYTTIFTYCIKEGKLMCRGLCLGMVKMEAFEDSHFMPQAVRVRLTDHTGSIIPLMACIFDLKKTFWCNRTLVLCRRAIALVYMISFFLSCTRSTRQWNTALRKNIAVYTPQNMLTDSLYWL